MKFYIYVTVIIGILIFLGAAGVELPSSSLVKSMNIINDDGTIGFQNIKVSALWTELITLLALAVAGGVIIGTFSRTPPESFLTAAFVSLTAGLIAGDMLFLFNLLNSFGQPWITWGALALLGPLMGGFIITAISYWRGND